VSPRILRTYDRLNQKTAIQFVDYVLEKLPFEVESIQTDNGSEFQPSFHWHVRRPGHPPRLHQAGDPQAERQGGDRTRTMLTSY
jgi:hypothetical protein